jgi:hypothetical protein
MAVTAAVRKEMEHIQKATAAWAAFRADVEKTATDSASERARSAREEKDDTTYHQTTNQQQGA